MIAIFILITNLIILAGISMMMWWRWKERNLNKQLEDVILTLPKIEEMPLRVAEIRGEVVTGSMVEDGELESEEKPVEVREWENEQRWLRRRKQAES